MPFYDGQFDVVFFKLKKDYCLLFLHWNQLVEYFRAFSLTLKWGSLLSGDRSFGGVLTFGFSLAASEN